MGDRLGIPGAVDFFSLRRRNDDVPAGSGGCGSRVPDDRAAGDARGHDGGIGNHRGASGERRNGRIIPATNGNGFFRMIYP